MTEQNPGSSRERETAREGLLRDLTRAKTAFELKTYSTGKNVKIVNSLNRSTTSQACCIQ
jgi:hypothetical protein